MRRSDKLKAGDFNYMSQDEQPDGSVLITLTKRGDPHVYKMVVKNLYQPDEEVISEEVIEV